MNKYATVTEFLDNLDETRRVQVQQLRDIILKVNPNLGEHIKWNSPSYVLDGEDRVTFNIQNKQQLVKLVLHMGATRVEDKKGEPVMKDDAGLIEWNSDIRGVITFQDADDVESKKIAVAKIIGDWLHIS